MADVLEHLRRFEQLEGQRAPFDNVAQQLADVMFPLGNDIQTIRWPGELRTQRLYDTTAMISAERLAGYLYALVTNFHTSWFQFRIGGTPLDQEGLQWLDTCRAILQDEMTADDSSLPTSVYDYFQQLVVFATACHFTDEQPIGLTPTVGFRGYTSVALPWSSYVIADNVTHRVDTVYRTFQYSVRQAVQQWGVEALSPPMQQIARDAANQRRLDQLFPFVHGVFPRATSAMDAVEDRRQMPWGSLYIDRQHKHGVDEGGYELFPYQVSRWGKPNVETPWGWGRGHMALPEALTLNAIDQDALRALRMHIFPPVWVIGAGRETVGSVSLRPGAINPLATGSSVQWANPGGHFDVQQLSIEARQHRIQQIFFLDILQTIPPLDARPRGNVTAYEIAQRIRLTAQVLGPAFMRILHEFLNPFIDSTFGMLLMARAFPDPPDSILQAAAQNQGRIDVDYQGPLARATQSEDVAAIEQLLHLGMSIGQGTGDMAILDNLDLDQAYRRYAEVLGVPPHLLRDPRQVTALRQARAQVAQQQAQQQQLLEGAKALGAAAPGLEVLQGLGQMEGMAGG